MSTRKPSQPTFQERCDEFFRTRRERSLEFLKSFGYPTDEVRQIPPPPKLPAFPTLLELTEASTNEPVKKDYGVFVELLLGRADILLQDALSNKSEYDEETFDLLERLYTGRLKKEELNDRQVRILDEATTKFFSRPEVNNPEAHPKPPKKLWKPPVEITNEEAVFHEKEEATPQGEDGLPAFWWLKEK